MGKLINEFKEFVMRGNVMDLAVGVIIGGAFSSIVTSLCDDVIMPSVQFLIGSIAGLSGSDADDIDKMTAMLNIGPIKFGAFTSAIINFLIMAIIIFAIVKAVNKLMTIPKIIKPGEEETPTTKECPFCKSEVAYEATRCPHCTSILEIAEEALKDDESEEKKEEE